jgi:hypothetical protein
MIAMRKQLSFGDGPIADEVSDLREPWMPHADVVLADEEIVATVYEALGEATSLQSWPPWCTGRDGAAVAGPQAHPQLEL